MRLRNLRIWLPCSQVVLASALLFLARAQSAAHHAELARANLLYQFDYYPAALQWLVALYAPSVLLTFPVAEIPRIPRLAVAVWFVLCIGAFWYWLTLRLEEGREVRQLHERSRTFFGRLFNWLGLFFSLALCFVSASAARQGGLPLMVDICGFLWGLGLLVLFVRDIWKMRAALSSPALR
jgi:hypothetical protein